MKDPTLPRVILKTQPVVVVVLVVGSHSSSSSSSNCSSLGLDSQKHLRKNRKFII